jgi:glycosyltransferase involved in cell wall biosynthesis
VKTVPKEAMMSPLTCPQRYDLAVIFRPIVSVGGTERHTVELLNYLTEATDLRVVYFQSNVDLRDIGLREVPGKLDVVHVDLPLREPGGGDLGRDDFRAWARLLKERPAERMLLIKPGFFVAGLKLLKLIRQSAAKVFHFEHSLPPPIPRRWTRLHFGFLPGLGLWWYKELWRRWRMSRLVDKVFVDSESARQELLKHGLLKEDQVVAFLNGLDVNRWSRDGAKAKGFRERYRIPPGSYLFGAAGRLDPLKGTDLALQSFARLRERGGVDTFLCIVGDGPYRGDLERLARELNLGGRVVFTGYVDDIGAAYSAIDTLVFPSELESCPLVLLEAMGCGCRLIASPVGGVAELMGDSDCGDLMPTRDPGDWADVMRRHCGTPAGERPACAARIRDFVVKNHDQRRQFEFLAGWFGAREATLAAC